jgi:D-tyrosyl-tRNA(Tyr) deacylase
VTFEYVLVVSEEDPVARAVAEAWGTPPSTGPRIDGSPVRALSDRVGLLRRPGLHIHDEALRVPGDPPGDPAPTLVFPSVHRSATDTAALTVHPLGNLGDSNEVGGRPRTLVPTDPRRMADALRRVAEVGRALGWPASLEATHHGPALEQPAFFVEIGAPDFEHPPEIAVREYGRLLTELAPDPSDRVALALGGGHYAPHFSDLVLERRWAVGHVLPRYAEPLMDRTRLADAAAKSPGLSGTLYHRAEDRERWSRCEPPPMLRESEAPRRGTATGESSR